MFCFLAFFSVIRSLGKGCGGGSICIQRRIGPPEPMDVSNVTIQGSPSFARLVNGDAVSQFCVMGAPVALAEFAEGLRYSSGIHWFGNEPMRITVAAAYDSQVIHAAAESWILVQSSNDHPVITADEVSFQVPYSHLGGDFLERKPNQLDTKVQVGRSVAITGINIMDPDAGDQTRWMTLLVAASTGRGLTK